MWKAKPFKGLPWDRLYTRNKSSHPPAGREANSEACLFHPEPWVETKSSLLPPRKSTWVAVAVVQSVENLKEQQDGVSRNTVSPHRAAHPAPGHPDSIGLVKTSHSVKYTVEQPAGSTNHWLHQIEAYTLRTSSSNQNSNQQRHEKAEWKHKLKEKL